MSVTVYTDTSCGLAFTGLGVVIKRPKAEPYTTAKLLEEPLPSHIAEQLSALFGLEEVMRIAEGQGPITLFTANKAVLKAINIAGVTVRHIHHRFNRDADSAAKTTRKLAESYLKKKTRSHQLL